jgi:hypothetical protein
MLRVGGYNKYVQNFIAEPSWKVSIWKIKKKKEDELNPFWGDNI